MSTLSAESALWVAEAFVGCGEQSDEWQLLTSSLRNPGVARLGYDAMLKSRLVVINDWKLSLLLNWIVPLLPRRTVLKVSRQAMEKS